MRPFSLVLAITVFVCAPVLRADVVSYPNIGTVPPTVPLTAAATGQVVGYFYGASAGGSDYVRMIDVTSGYASLFLLDGHGTQPGDSANFGAVTTGDKLVFQLVDSDVENNKDGADYGNTYAPFDPNAQVNGWPEASDPAYSVDGVNHAYVTAFSGDAALGIPSGLFFGMEDLPYGASDRDYNDLEFVVTDVSVTGVTPEPESLMLFGTGALGLLGVCRRRSVSEVRGLSR